MLIESESNLSFSQLMVCHPCPSHFDRSLCSLDHQKIHPQWKNANLMYQHHVGGIYLSNICLYCTDLYLYLKCSHITRGYYCTYLFLKHFAPTEARNNIYSHITRGYYCTYLYFFTWFRGVLPHGLVLPRPVIFALTTVIMMVNGEAEN